MAVFSRILELKVNGDTVADDDNYEVNDDTETPTGTPEPEETTNATDDEDNFTIDAPDEGDLGNQEDTDDDVEDTSAESEEDNFTVDGGDAEGGGEGGAQGVDTTEGGGGEGEGEEGGGEQQAASDNAPANPTDGVSDEDMKNSEQQIYDTLTDEEKRIRTLQLKKDYNDLYDIIVNLEGNINSIPKTSLNINKINRLKSYIIKSRSILISYIDNVFDTKPYIENYAIYIKYMAMLKTATTVINEIAKENAENNKKA